MLFDQIVTKEPIDKGWSGDQKYRITLSDGAVCLLRISPMEHYAQKQAQFQRMTEAAELGIAMNLPLEFGTCGDGVYVILSWIDGFDAEEHIPTFCRREQYALGWDAGVILCKLHTLPAPADAEDWFIRFNRKIDRKIAMYENCPLKYDGGEAFLDYLRENRHLLAGRPQSYQHGDYHIGNMMLDRAGKLHIIDFDRDDYGDPWEEFNRIVWCAQAAPYFASGMVDGYFGGQVPMEFWKLLALYICCNTLSSLPWAIPFGEGEVLTMRRQAAEVLDWYDCFRTVIPGWYCHP